MNTVKEALKELKVDETVFVVPKSKITDGYRYITDREAKVRAAAVARLERSIIENGLEYAINDMMDYAVTLRAHRLAELKQAVKSDLETIKQRNGAEADFCIERTRDLQAYYKLAGRSTSLYTSLNEMDFYYLGVKDGEAGKMKQYVDEQKSLYGEESE